MLGGYEFSIQTLSNIVMAMLVIWGLFHLPFTIWSYFQLRNKQGPRGPPGISAGEAQTQTVGNLVNQTLQNK